VAASPSEVEESHLVTLDREPLHAIGSFAGKAGQAVAVEIRRMAGAAQVVAVTPKVLDPTTMFLDARKANVEVVVHDKVKIQCIHIWSYAGETYQDQVEEQLDSRGRTTIRPWHNASHDGIASKINVFHFGRIYPIEPN